MRRVFFLLVVVIFVPGSMNAAELIMFDSPVCEWCEIWEDEVGIVYHKFEFKGHDGKQRCLTDSENEINAVR